MINHRKLVFCIIIPVLVGLALNSVKAQERAPSVQVSGKIRNFSNQEIKITAAGINATILTDSAGVFKYHTDKLTQPGYAIMQFGTNAQLDLYLAPGYDIKVSGNALNTQTLYNSLILSGVGAQTNQYWKQVFSLYERFTVKPLTNEWYDIKPESFVKIGLEKDKLDSLENYLEKNVFGISNHDPFKEVFREMSFVEMNVTKLFYLLAYRWWNELSVSQTDSLIQQAINPRLFTSLNTDGLIGDFYFQEVVAYFYPDYLIEKQSENDPSIYQNSLKRALEICDSLFTGKTKDYVLQRIINRQLPVIYSQNQLNLLKPFILLIQDKQVQNDLLFECTQRSSEIESVAVGKEAPDFSLPDFAGRYHSLQDYRGKVVYIDLWASWCGPCKEELPLLKEIHDQHISDSSSFQIISIAVKDSAGKTLRSDLVNKLQLNWLQLEDEQDFVWNKYKVTFVPRYILIDKQGKILSFDAARPSQKTELERLLNNALEK
ncbi:MAG: TlpA family protein disulfide reductase [Chitinophagaceae bacterium]|nr:TlpA family protein disulfide reductase [Chitinophagaceae bacterium]